MKNYIALIGTLFLLQTWACHENNNFPVTPSLTFLGMEKDTLIQGFSAEDSIIIYLELKDGDGDIGFESDDTINKSVLIRDLRTGNIYLSSSIFPSYLKTSLAMAYRLKCN